jgi:broad specificity phosphatase PhoE
MTTTVYLVRHCQSIANTKRLYNCRLEQDEGLSEEGRKQAQKLALFFRKRKISAIYSSPFPRAMQTASAIGQHTGLEIREVDDLREARCGEWEGNSEQEIMKLFPKAWEGWHKDPQSHPIPGGETLLAMQARALPKLEELVKKHKGGSIVIVTHYCIFNVILCSLLSSLANFWCFDTGNGTVAEIKMENVPRLQLYAPIGDGL